MSGNRECHVLFGVANSWPRADGENRKAPDALGTLAARPFIVAGTPLHVNRCSFEVKLPVRLVRFLFPSWGVWNSSIDINEDFRSEARASATGRPVYAAILEFFVRIDGVTCMPPGEMGRMYYHPQIVHTTHTA